MNPNYPGGGGGYGGPPGGGAPGGYGGPPGGGPPGGYGGGPPGGAPPGGYGGGPPGYGPPGGPGGYGPPGGYGGGPPGFGAGPGGAAPDDLRKKVDFWFIMSIVSVFCGCGILGIINIIYANGAKQALAVGDFATASSKIGTAKTLCIIGYVLLPIAIALQIMANWSRF
jgi:Interferon-induced transmembrane protein